MRNGGVGPSTRWLINTPEINDVLLCDQISGVQLGNKLILRLERDGGSNSAFIFLFEPLPQMPQMPRTPTVKTRASTKVIAHAVPPVPHPLPWEESLASASLELSLKHVQLAMSQKGFRKEAKGRGKTGSNTKLWCPGLLSCLRPFILTLTVLNNRYDFDVIKSIL